LRHQAVVDGKDVVDHILELMSPNLNPCRRIRELHDDAHTIAGSTHAAPQHVADAEFGCDLTRVGSAIPEGERGRARDYEQPTLAAERDGDVLNEAIDEGVLARITAEIGEGENDDRGLVGQRGASGASQRHR
jgi:hypothetical protein